MYTDAATMRDERKSGEVLAATDGDDGRGEHWPRNSNVRRHSEAKSKGLGDAPEFWARERRRLLFRPRLVSSVNWSRQVGIGWWGHGAGEWCVHGSPRLGRAEATQEPLSDVQ